MEIKWWITSALESNIGLNAIAQFCGEFEKLFLRVSELEIYLLAILNVH